MSRTAKDSKGSIESKLKTTPIAIIGMGSIFPQAHNTQEYWDNILKKMDCITDVPPSRWKIEDYYDPNPAAPDKTYCKRGGFIPDTDFDPMEFGLPPNILEVTDVSQLLSLIVARDALEDAGYGEDRVFERENVGVVLGVVGMSSKLFTPLINRLQYPVWEKVLRSAGVSESDTARLVEKMKLAYIGWEENAFPGAIGNVISGRICNRFDLGGVNCVVDAACASSLAAIKMSVSELIEGRADMMITGGVDADNTINTYMCFSKTPAFSKSDRVRTFDAESDGMMVGEGIGMVVMKRLEDAERDGDRVYAVIKAIGTSSDGRFKSIYAPRPAGQAKALRRAYAEAGFEPATVGLIEAHGTGTMAGDPAEFQGLNEVFGENNARRQYIALGSVKSQIAHTKAAAGVASLMKTALALYHKVLPASINVTKPNPKFGIENTPFYVNTEVRPWIRAHSAPPRRAGVSSFGFGGTNFHVVLEEAQAEHNGPYRVQPVAQPVLLAESNPTELLALCRREMQALSGADGERHLVALAAASRVLAPDSGAARIGFVASGLEEARSLLQVGIDALAEKPQAASWEHPKGVFYRQTGLDTQGKVVALFSGQGSQYLEMGRELAVNFPTFRQVYGAFDELFVQDGLEPLSTRVYPHPVFDTLEREQLADLLTSTEHAQPAIGAFSAGLYKLLQLAGFAPDFVAGHSFGELTALWAGGVLSDEDYYSLAKARGKAMAPPADANFDAGSMMAVKGDGEKVRAALQSEPDVVLANWNSNNQVVIAGSKAALARAQATLNAQGFSTIALPVSAAFHTPLVGHAQKPFAAAIKKANFKRPAVKVYANGTGRQHSQDPEAVRQALAGHILNPVLFRDEIQNIYADGGRVFVEFGPKNVLTNLVGNILEGQPHVAVALNANAKKDSDRQLREAVMLLRVAGLPLVNFDPFEQVRPVKTPRKKSPVTVQLNAGYYITEKTRMAYVNALNDGFQVGALKTAAGSTDSNNVEQVAQAAQPAAPVHAGANGASLAHNVYAPTAIVPAVTTAPAATASANAGLDSATAEHLLVEYQSHQVETLRLHEQYLRTEEEYARAFAQLTQLQTELVSKGSAEAGQLAAVLPLFESLERSMTRFHEHQSETLRIHQRYLETQERFSTTFVQGLSTASAPAAVSSRPTLAAPAAVGPSNGVAKNAFPAAPPAPAAVAPVVARPAVVAALAPVAPAPVVVSSPPNTAAIGAVSAEVLSTALLQIVSDKTGYPVETLELEMDMEADLGIDSIKRVEILGAMQTHFPELPRLDPSELGELRTLGQITGRLGAAQPAAVQSPAGPVATQSSMPAPAAAAVVQTNPSTTVSVEQVTATLLQVVSEKTGYPQETLELDMDMEADLGIDSIKRVEILGAMQLAYSELPKLDPAELGELCSLRQIIDRLSAQSAPAAVVVAAEAAPAQPAPAAVAAPAAVSTDVVASVAQALLQVVSDKTGYPVETLELEMDMEADLGIDSIKRVEILGAMQTQFPDLPKPQPDLLAELCTLQQIITFLSSSTVPAAGQQEAPSGEVRPFELPEESGIEQGVVTRKQLPSPDFIDFTLPAGYSCLLTDDGSPATAGLAQALVARGWPVGVLRFPADMMPSRQALPEQVTVLALEDMSEAHLQDRLTEVARLNGPVAVFIHMAPAAAFGSVPLTFPEGQQALVKMVFLAAKHLKPGLNQAGQQGRAVFMTVTHLDGEFGLGQNSDYDPVNGGLFGLVKTLNLEWESVFCRAVDLHPALEPERQVSCILAELHDPNRLLIEVGYTSTKRSTLTLSPLPVTGA